MFALTIWNPNYMKRRSWYMRKVSILFFGNVGWNFNRKFYEDHITNMMLKQNDYYPIEVKRALRDKDFRHLALFDHENPGR